MALLPLLRTRITAVKPLFHWLVTTYWQLPPEAALDELLETTLELEETMADELDEELLELEELILDADELEPGK